MSPALLTSDERQALQLIDNGAIAESWVSGEGDTEIWRTVDLHRGSETPGGVPFENTDWIIERGLGARRPFNPAFPQRMRPWELTPAGLSALDSRPKVTENPFETHPETVTALEAALYYASLGIPVFPTNANKAPMVKHGFHDASTDAEQIKKWFTRWPKSNVTARTGTVIDVIDLDTPEAIAELARHIAAGELTLTSVSQSAREGGGFHYFVLPTGSGNRARMFDVSGFDYRGYGGYALMPGDPTLNRRRWKRFFRRDLVGLEPGPIQLVADMAEKRRPDPIVMTPAEARAAIEHRYGPNPTTEMAWAAAALEGEQANILSAPSGGSHYAIFNAGCKVYQIVNAGLLTDAEVTNALMAAGMARGISQGEMITQLNSARDTVAGQVRLPPEKTASAARPSVPVLAVPEVRLVDSLRTELASTDDPARTLALKALIAASDRIDATESREDYDKALYAAACRLQRFTNADVVDAEERATVLTEAAAAHQNKGGVGRIPEGNVQATLENAAARVGDEQPSDAEIKFLDSDGAYAAWLNPQAPEPSVTRQPADQQVTAQQSGPEALLSRLQTELAATSDPARAVGLNALMGASEQISSAPATLTSEEYGRKFSANAYMLQRMVNGGFVTPEERREALLDADATRARVNGVKPRNPLLVEGVVARTGTVTEMPHASEITRFDVGGALAAQKQAAIDAATPKLSRREERLVTGLRAELETVIDPTRRVGLTALVAISGELDRADGQSYRRTLFGAACRVKRLENSGLVRPEEGAQILFEANDVRVGANGKPHMDLKTANSVILQAAEAVGSAEASSAEIRRFDPERKLDAAHRAAIEAQKQPVRPPAEPLLPRLAAEQQTTMIPQRQVGLAALADCVQRIADAPLAAAEERKKVFAAACDLQRLVNGRYIDPHERDAALYETMAARSQQWGAKAHTTEEVTSVLSASARAVGGDDLPPTGYLKKFQPPAPTKDPSAPTVTSSGRTRPPRGGGPQPPPPSSRGTLPPPAQRTPPRTPPRAPHSAGAPTSAPSRAGTARPAEARRAAPQTRPPAPQAPAPGDADKPARGWLRRAFGWGPHEGKSDSAHPTQPGPAERIQAASRTESPEARRLRVDPPAREHFRRGQDGPPPPSRGRTL